MPRSAPEMSASRVLLRPLCAQDEAAFLAAVAESRALHQDWVAPPTTPEAFAAYLERLQQPGHASWVAVLPGRGELVGVFNLSQIVMGLFCNACLGYYSFARHSGQGLMSEGLQLLVRHAFDGLGLHRLEANIQPGNRASIALVRRAGFRLEGYSPRYLKIAGQWRDHERWALLADD